MLMKSTQASLNQRKGESRMIDTRKAINLADLRPEELESRLELQVLSFGGGDGSATGGGFFGGGDGSATGGGFFGGGDGSATGGGLVS